jgi:gliding motility-associated protein GldM
MKPTIWKGLILIGTLIAVSCSSADKEPIKETVNDTIVIRDTVELQPQPSAIAIPAATQVLYRGVENPIQLFTSGINPEDVNVLISNGNLKKTSGGYTILPNKSPSVTLTVQDISDSDTAVLNQMEFKVKNMPDPKPFFGGKTGSDNIPKRDLLAAQGVVAKMENFEFDVKFDVISYTVSATVRGNVVEAPCRGARLTGDARTIIRELKSGQKLYIEKIKARGPDGTVRDLGTIALRVI